MYMSILKMFCTGIIFFFLGISVNAQISVPPNVAVTYAEKIGVTAPLRDLARMASTPEERRKQAKKTRKFIPNFMGRGRRPEPNPDALPNGPDPVLQISNSTFNSSIAITPNVNMDGMTTEISNANVPDPVGDIGKDCYVQVVNSTFLQVFDKQGNALSEPIAANTIWASLGFNSGGDPIILYDHKAQRWILTEFPNFQGGNQLLIAVSQDTDPLGSWAVYNFGTQNFPDYPKYSIWPDALVLTTNEGNSNQLPAYFIDREALLSGAEEVSIQRLVIPGPATGPGFLTAVPVEWNGALPPEGQRDPLLLALKDDAWSGVETDQIELFTISIDFDEPDNTTFTVKEIPAAPFDTYPCAVSGIGFECIPQFGGQGIDGLPEIIMNQPHYRSFEAHESIVLNFITDATGNNRSGIRWMELRRAAGADWVLHQEGTFAPDDGLHRFMGAIAIDGGGNIGLGYSVSSLTTYPGLRFTGRLESDPLGVMTVDEYTLVEGSGATNNDRFGDYAHLGVDPLDNRSFWFTGHYMTPAGWSTRIARFQIEKDTFDIGPFALEAPQNSPVLTAEETVKIRVKNYGLQAISGFNVGYIFEEQEPVVASVNTIVTPGATYLHTFSPTVEMAEIGTYDFKIFTSNGLDEAKGNDTINLIVSKLPEFDTGITALRGLEVYSCNDSITAEYEFYNFGTATLTALDIDVKLNGHSVTTVNWQGTLTSGNSLSASVLVQNLSEGPNELSVEAYNPNGVVDQRPENNGMSRGFSVSGEERDITLTLNLDEYPNETTWKITDVQDNTLFSGGPYITPFVTISETWCLDPRQCYKLTLNDSYGDGFCCDFGNGNYTLTDPDDNVLVQGLGNIAVTEEIDFCVDFTCLLTAEINTSEPTPSNQNGIMLIQPSNGLAPYSYSIDDGMTFQSSNIFTGLNPGNYQVVVQDQNNCAYNEIVTLRLMTTSTTANSVEVAVQVYPNPTTGVFEVRISGLSENSNNLELQIFSATGQRIQTVRIPNYNGIYQGLVSVAAQPVGLYFLKFKTKNIKELFPILKLSE